MILVTRASVWEYITRIENLKQTFHSAYDSKNIKHMYVNSIIKWYTTNRK